MGNWKKDLREGNLAEVEFGNLLKHRTPGLNMEFNSDYKWDLKYGTNTFECKAEAKASVTGNVCIEFEWNGHPSGIEVTEADYWAVKALGVWSICPVKVLRNYCKDYRITTCGDSLKGKAYLIPYTDYQYWCTVIINEKGVTIPCPFIHTSA